MARSSEIDKHFLLGPLLAQEAAKTFFTAHGKTIFDIVQTRQWDGRAVFLPPPAINWPGTPRQQAAEDGEEDVPAPGKGGAKGEPLPNAIERQPRDTPRHRPVPPGRDIASREVCPGCSR